MAKSNSATSSSKAMSKTKAKAWRHKPKRAVPLVKTSSGDSSSSPRHVLLTKLLEQHAFNMPSDMVDNSNDPGLSFCAILSELGMNNRNTGWRNVWKELHSEGLIEQTTALEGGAFFTSPFQLSKTGIDQIATDEYKATLPHRNAPTPKSNQEHHDQIKSKLMNDRGIQIFDILLEHGPHTRKQLAARLGIRHTGAYFSYALKQLKELGFVETYHAKPGEAECARAVCLSQKAFVQTK